MKFDAEYHRKWYQENKERIKEAKRLARGRYREKIDQLIVKAKSKPCADCCKEFPSCAMDFDHRGNKEFTIGEEKYEVGEEKLLAEIAKCDVVCAICHRIRTQRVLA